MKQKKQFLQSNLVALNLQVLKFNAYIHRFQILKATAVISAVYVLLSLFSISVLIGFGLFFGSLAGIVYFRWKLIKRKGLINYVSPKGRKFLLERSLYDVYRDLIYYPYFTKILGIFIQGAIGKPHPQKLDQVIEQLPENIKAAIYKKGVLSLAPQKIERLVLQKQSDILDELQQQIILPLPLSQPQPQSQQKEIQPIVVVKPMIPKNFGKQDKKWDRIEQYEAGQFKVHEHTMSKRMLLTLNQKVKWQHILPLAGLLSFMLMKVKSRRLAKIFLYNGTMLGIITLFVLIIIKYKHPGYINVKQKKRDIQNLFKKLSSIQVQRSFEHSISQ